MNPVVAFLEFAFSVYVQGLVYGVGLLSAYVVLKNRVRK